jgi:hypothetical protein
MSINGTAGHRKSGWLAARGPATLKSQPRHVAAPVIITRAVAPAPRGPLSHSSSRPPRFESRNRSHARSFVTFEHHSAPFRRDPRYHVEAPDITSQPFSHMSSPVTFHPFVAPAHTQPPGPSPGPQISRCSPSPHYSSHMSSPSSRRSPDCSLQPPAKPQSL